MARKKRSVSAATKERLRRMRQKYHLGEYKGHGVVHKTKRHRGVHMARRRRHYAPVRFARARRYAGRHKKQAAGELALLGYAMFGEPLIDNMASKFNVGLPTNIVKIGAGYFLKKKSGLMGQFGTAMYTIELYKLGKQIQAGGFNLGSLFGGTTTATVTTTDAVV